jgi:hypothetical protein
MLRFACSWILSTGQSQNSTPSSNASMNALTNAGASSGLTDLTESWGGIAAGKRVSHAPMGKRT